MNWKAVFGVFLMVCGITLGLYVGVWLCLIGGIINIIEQFQAEHINAFIMALNIAKVMLSAMLGWVTLLILFLPGLDLVKKS